jgi:hypothetical protein
MVSSQSANTITSTTSQYGTSKPIPKVLPYPDYLNYEFLKNIEQIYCYIQDRPQNVNLTVLIFRDVDNDGVITICADQTGEPIELTTDKSETADAARKFIKEKLVSFVTLMNTIKITQAQFHFCVAEELILVDVRTAINKYVSPGLIEDVFGKIIKTLKIKNMMVLEPSTIDAIIQGQGPFVGDLLIRPSRFRLLNETDQNNVVPLYVEIKR